MIELVFEDKFYQDIKNGKKKTIGDIDIELAKIKKGDTVIFKNIGTKTSEKISVKVKDIHRFNDVSAMLKEMKLKTIFPRSKSYKDGEKFFEEKYGNKLKDAKFIAFTFDILDNKLTVPPGYVIRASINSNGKGPIINLQPENEAELHMQERHERFNRNATGPRIKNKKSGKNSGQDENKDEDVFGPRIKNKKNEDVFGPRIKNKKNDDFSGPRIKNKKNDDFSGPRIKNKKNNSNHPPRQFEITIKDPWFSLIENGQKTVEARLFKGIFTQFRVNDTIRFINKWNGIEKSVLVKITKLTKYPNFGDLLFSEQLYKVLPGIPNIKCGITVYDKIYKDFSEIKEHGTLAIELELV
jgi:ASC-1-like (ASCH) protein